MDFQRSVFWASIGGIIALVAVAAVIEEPLLRAAMSLIAVSPLLYIAFKVARLFEWQAAQQKRRYMSLREVTDEFIMHVRNLNRITVASQIENAPDNVSGMIDEIIERRHKLVERMREVAGRPATSGPGEGEGDS